MSPRAWQQLWLGLGLVGLLAIGAASLMPPPPLPGPDLPHGDKWLHAGVYAGCMLWFAQLADTAGQRWRWFGALFAYSLLLEGLQALAPTRESDPLDAVANLTGLTVGLVLASRTRAGRILHRISTS